MRTPLTEYIKEKLESSLLVIYSDVDFSNSDYARFISRFKQLIISVDMLTEINSESSLRRVAHSLNVLARVMPDPAPVAIEKAFLTAINNVKYLVMYLAVKSDGTYEITGQSRTLIDEIAEYNRLINSLFEANAHAQTHSFSAEHLHYIITGLIRLRRCWTHIIALSNEAVKELPTPEKIAVALYQDISKTSAPPVETDFLTRILSTNKRWN